jgi:hypothetical protein
MIRTLFAAPEGRQARSKRLLPATSYLMRKTLLFLVLPQKPVYSDLGAQDGE